MPAERLAPDGVTLTNLTGALANIQDDPDNATDTTWLVATADNVSTTANCTFPTPTPVLTGTQEIRVKVRKFSATQSGTPTCRLDLYQAGVLLSSGTAVNVTDATAQVISRTFAASLVTNPAGLEVRVEGITTGGPPGVRNTVDVGAVEWNTSYTVNTAPTASFTASPNPAPEATTAIALDGTASSDPDGTIASYLWELVSGPSTGTFSSTSTATTTFTPSSFTPASIPNLAVWLEGDAITGLANLAAVASWPDQSSNARNATQATGTKQPLYVASGINAKPVVRFDGTDDEMLVAGLSATTSTQTLVAVFKPTSLTDVTALVGSPTAIGSRWWFGNSAPLQVSRDGFWTATASSNGMVSGTARIEAVTIATGGNINYYVNNAAAGSVAAGDAFSGTHPDSSIGAHLSNSTRFANGDFAAVLAYDRVLTTTEMADLHTYLGNKYGIVV